MNIPLKFREKYLRYCTIKTKTLAGNKISKKEALEALKIKRELNKLREKK